MRHILASVFLIALLFPALALGGEVKWKDLVVQDGLFYKKFTNVPFTGKITGTIKTTMREGKKDGPWVVYYNGQVRSKGTYKNGKKEGPWVSYYENGQLLTKGTYKDGKKEGSWVGHGENGQLLSEGTYKNEKKEGFWVWYHDDGQLRKIETYKNGVKISD